MACFEVFVELGFQLVVLLGCETINAMCRNFGVRNEFNFVVGITLFGKRVGMILENRFVLVKEFLDFRWYRVFLDLLRFQFRQ